MAIKRYVISFWNGIDLRYKLLKDPGVKISIAGIIISRVSQSHYSKSQIFVQKFNFDKNPNIFTSFSPKFFLTIFLVKSKFHDFFQDFFSREKSR